jgi:hypothetical protein
MSTGRKKRKHTEEEEEEFAAATEESWNQTENTSKEIVPVWQQLLNPLSAGLQPLTDEYRKNTATELLVHLSVHDLVDMVQEVVGSCAWTYDEASAWSQQAMKSCSIVDDRLSAAELLRMHGVGLIERMRGVTSLSFYLHSQQLCMEAEILNVFRQTYFGPPGEISHFLNRLERQCAYPNSSTTCLVPTQLSADLYAHNPDTCWHGAARVRQQMTQNAYRWIKSHLPYRCTVIEAIFIGFNECQCRCLEILRQISCEQILNQLEHYVTQGLLQMDYRTQTLSWQ